MNYKKSLMVTFVACWLYWIYLYFFSQMTLKFDALGFKNLGMMIFEKSWEEYFRGGPQREPVYPFLISFSMQIASKAGTDFIFVQKLFQVILLFMTQLLALCLLNAAQVKDSVKIGVLLYMGFSPALVNATFSLFSEIAAFPLSIGLILIHTITWRSIRSEGRLSNVLLGVLTGLAYFLMTCTKGIYQFIFLLALIPYGIMFLLGVCQQRKGIWTNTLAFALTAMLAMQIPMFGYKAINQKYNGHFAFTNRAPGLLYGNVYKRTADMSARQFLAHIATVPGDGVCRKIFTEKECRYCTFHEADNSREGTVLLTKDLPESEHDKAIYAESLKMMTKKPFQFATLWVIESFRMPFWESTRVGYVTYPNWMNKLFQLNVFSDAVRLVVSLLTLVSYLWVLVAAARQLKSIFSVDIVPSKEATVAFFIIYIVTVFTALYSLFSIVVRYSLVIAPLYLVVIGIFLNNMCQKFAKNDK